MKKIAVTGAGGFVGRNLTAFLEARGFEVLKISLRNPLWKAGVPQGVFAVVHLAGLAHDLKNASRPEDYFKVNADLTREVFDFFSTLETWKFIFLSSVKAVSDGPGDAVLSEDAIPDPQTPYGKSKLEAERYILSEETKMRVYALRPCMIHGPGNKGNLNLLYKMVSKGIPYPFARYENVRSFLSVDNLNDVIGEICSREIEPGIYNVADTGTFSSLEIVNIINSVLGKKPRNLRINSSILGGLADVCGALRLPFSRETLKKLTENYQVSNDKILAALQRPLPLTATQGLIRTFESFRKD